MWLPRKMGRLLVFSFILFLAAPASAGSFLNNFYKNLFKYKYKYYTGVKQPFTPHTSQNQQAQQQATTTQKPTWHQRWEARRGVHWDKPGGVKFPRPRKWYFRWWHKREALEQIGIEQSHYRKLLKLEERLMDRQKQRSLDKQRHRRVKRQRRIYNKMLGSRRIRNRFVGASFEPRLPLPNAGFGHGIMQAPPLVGGVFYRVRTDPMRFPRRLLPPR